MIALRTIRDRYETVLRFVEILRVVITEAVGYLLTRDSLPDRVHRAVILLGPTFVKLGQIASTRPDLVEAAAVSRVTLGRSLGDGGPPRCGAHAVSTPPTSRSGT